MKFPRFLVRFLASFSYVGLIVATIFFAASLTPSLLPRVYLVQGVLSGFALAAGYCVGWILQWLWRALQLAEPTGNTLVWCKRLTTVCVAIVALGYLWRATVWQNSIRELMKMEPIESADPWRIGLIAVLSGLMLLIVVRVFWKACSIFADKLSRFLPRRLSYLVSTVLVGSLLLLLVNDVFAKFALHVADATFAKIDEVTPADIEPPTEPVASGSPNSLIVWDSIGHQGQKFIATGPTQKKISEFSGVDAIHPLRVYVGLRSRDTLQERAQLALAELKRVGAFGRTHLVIATPTGTGWLDPSAVDTLEYLHRGDTAIVSMQYSYLPSWLTILVDPDLSKESAHVLFDEIYGYWKSLEPNSRPKLYLHGLSLGSLGSEDCADLFTLFEDPIQGAVWSGPPFPSAKWSKLTKGRNRDSPAWLPTFRDGSMVRFTAKKNAINQPGKRWGPMRFVYIQHASDPMIFFSPDLLFHKPDWLVGERGPDVSPYLGWWPIVTFLQTAFDLPMATTVPMGYGHNYAPSSYIDAWIAVTDPDHWTTEDTIRLKRLFQDSVVKP